MGRGWHGSKDQHKQNGIKGGTASVLARLILCTKCKKLIDKKKVDLHFKRFHVEEDPLTLY